MEITGNREGSQAKFQELAVDPSQFVSIGSKTATSLNNCALYCRFISQISEWNYSCLITPNYLRKKGTECKSFVWSKSDRNCDLGGDVNALVAGDKLVFIRHGTWIKNVKEVFKLRFQ